MFGTEVAGAADGPALRAGLCGDRRHGGVAALAFGFGVALVATDAHCLVEHVIKYALS